MVALPSDLELVECAAETYTAGAVPDFQDVDRAIRVFLTKRPTDGLQIVAIEGTHSFLGWTADLLALSTVDQQGMNDQTLGFLHSGFYATALAALTRCSLIAAAGPYAICGHSLGAALALLIGALLSQDDFQGRNLAPVKIGAFAPPRVGGAQFVKVVTAIPFCAYRYGDDIVPEVPFTVPEFPYEQVPLTPLADPLHLDRFAAHSIENYVTAIKALAS